MMMMMMVFDDIGVIGRKIFCNMYVMLILWIDFVLYWWRVIFCVNLIFLSFIVLREILSGMVIFCFMMFILYMNNDSFDMVIVWLLEFGLNFMEFNGKCMFFVFIKIN